MVVGPRYLATAGRDPGSDHWAVTHGADEVDVATPGNSGMSAGQTVGYRPQIIFAKCPHCL